jgi:hypothetical protein
VLTLEQTRRQARHIALPEIGAEGQARIAAGRVVLVTGGQAPAAATVAGDYLRAAGVGQVVSAATAADGEGWQQMLQGASVALRFSFDDDPFLRTAVKLGVPALIGTARPDGVDLFCFRRHGPCPHVEAQVPGRAAQPVGPPGAAAVVLGTLAAAEALALLIQPLAPPRARLLRLALGGDLASVQELPWAPACFLCGGHSPEANPA